MDAAQPSRSAGGDSTGAKQASLPSSSSHHCARVRVSKIAARRALLSPQRAVSSKSKASTLRPRRFNRTSRNFSSIGATDTYSPSAQRNTS